MKIVVHSKNSQFQQKFYKKLYRFITFDLATGGGWLFVAYTETSKKRASCVFAFYSTVE